MFILHSSNKTENLLSHLISVIENVPLSSPFSKEVFLIQSQGMERWLSQQLASHFGVWGNFEYLFPGKFFSSIAKAVDSQLNDEFFDRTLMLWRFERLLRDLPKVGFESIQHYLETGDVGLKRFQLAQKLSQIYDQYQIMRPDMIDLWEKNQLLYGTRSECWQRELWHKLTQHIEVKHRGALWLDLINKFNDSPANEFSAVVPERIFIFGLNTMPPLFLAFLQGLSKHCDVHLFLLNPAQGFWADLVNKQQIKETKDGHPLLSTLGQQGREFQQLLMDHTQFDFEPESFTSTEVKNSLQQIQNDLLANVYQPQPLVNDRSISIHACHSTFREVEVVKNEVLRALESDPILELKDIVIMAPDIEQYAPYISSVFHDIQHSIADKSLRLSNSAFDVLIRFLTIIQGRFGWQRVMDLLEDPLVYPRFSLTEIDLELISHWVAETQVRWGKSAEHKLELGLPGIQQNTWQAMLDRLLMGYAVDEDEFVAGILPYKDIEGMSALPLGGLADFLQLLFKASEELNQATHLKNWHLRLMNYSDRLMMLEKNQHIIERQQLQEMFLTLSDAIAEFHDQDVSLAVIIAWLETHVTENKSSTGFLRGQLTFCSMLPMRSIPFKVIALMGLNEGTFPHIDQQPTFDLIGQHFRVGDRSRRADDRYQFLEILLSVRQQLIISYRGLSIQNNAEIPPSVVVSELLDVLSDTYQLNDIVIKHPLKGFSPLYFGGDTQWVNYSEVDFQTAVAFAEQKKRPDLWWQGSLETPEPEIILLEELFAFFKHPQQYFMQRQIGLNLSDVDVEQDEREPFAIEGLEAYSIHQQWVAHCLQGKAFSLQKLQAQGRWLPGNLGHLLFEQQSQEINPFSDDIKKLSLGNQLENLPIDLMINNYRVIGKLSHLFAQGSLFYRYAKLKGKDFIAAWLHHLLVNQIQPQNTYLVSKEEATTCLYFAKQDADQAVLEKLIHIYLQGLKQPDVFFTEPAFAYVRQAKKLIDGSRSKELPIETAKKRFLDDLEYDRYSYKLFKNIEAIEQVLDPEFESLCQNLILPGWQSVKENNN